MDSWPWAWTGWVGFWFPMGRGGVVLNLENPILKIFSLRICNFRLKGHIVRMGQNLKNPSYTSCYQHSYQRSELIFEPLRCSVSKRVVFKDFCVFGAWKFFCFSLTFRGLTISLGSVLMLQKCHHRSSSNMVELIFESVCVEFDFLWQICQNLMIFRGRFSLTSGDQISGTLRVRLVLSILRFSSGYKYLLWLVKRQHFFGLGVQSLSREPVLSELELFSIFWLFVSLSWKLYILD